MQHVTRLFSVYWESGFFPREAKMNVLVNLPKKRVFTVDSCRPISLIPVLQRVYQNLIKDNINYKLSKEICDSQ